MTIERVYNERTKRLICKLRSPGSTLQSLDIYLVAVQWPNGQTEICRIAPVQPKVGGYQAEVRGVKDKRLRFVITEYFDTETWTFPHGEAIDVQSELEPRNQVQEAINDIDDQMEWNAR